MSEQQVCAGCGESGPLGDAFCGACGGDPLLDGRYRLRQVLGQGGMGLTFAAERVADGLDVAIKEMPFRLAADDDVRRLVEREARVLRQLQHPAIPAYIDDFIAGSGRHRALYLVQELVTGRTLVAEMDARRYALDDVLAIIEELCEVLAYLHGLHPPVIHRDIKPANVMRRVSGELVLLDFGAVRDAIQDGVIGGSTVAGTFGYMAPEQFRGDARPATDLYGLGVLAVQLLSRVPPDEMMDGQTLAWGKFVQVPKPALDLLTHMLAPEVARRIGDARALKARIVKLRADLQAGPSPEAPARAEGVRPEAVRPMPAIRSVFDPLRAAQAHFRIQPAGALELSLPENLRPRKKGVVMLLAVFLGWIGGPHWYLGHYISGVASLVFSWTFIPVVVSLWRAFSVMRMSDPIFDRIYNEDALRQYMLSLPAPEAPPSGPAALSSAAAEQLERLARLKASGALTEAEFDEQKARLLRG